MGWTTTILLAIALTWVGIANSQNAAGPNIFKWISVSEIPTWQNKLTPLAREYWNSQNWNFYLCRGWTRENWTPGKALVGNPGRENSCNIPMDSQDVPLYQDFEVLYFPINALEWQRWTGSVPVNALSVGADPNDRKDTFVCKGIINNNSQTEAIGKIVGERCILSYWVTYEVINDFDVLVMTVPGARALRPTYRV